MTELLRKAFEQAAKLPEAEQDALAALMLDDLASEPKWAEAVHNPQSKLNQLIDAAEQEFDEGKTRPLSELL